MAIPIIVAVIPYLVTGSEILGGIESGLSIIDHFQHKPDPAKKILAAIVKAEAEIIDAIHTETLNNHLIKIQTTEDWWYNVAWPEIVTVGFTLQSVGGSLMGVELNLPGKTEDLANALEYFRRNPISSTENMLDIILGAYSLFLLLKACEQAFFWIRAVKEGSVAAPDSKFADLSDTIKSGHDLLNKWTNQYLEYRLQNVSLKVTRDVEGQLSAPTGPLTGHHTGLPGGSSTGPHGIQYRYSFFIDQDAGGDAIIPKLESSTFVVASLFSNFNTNASVKRIFDGAWRVARF